MSAVIRHSVRAIARHLDTLEGWPTDETRSMYIARSARRIHSEARPYQVKLDRGSDLKFYLDNLGQVRLYEPSPAEIAQTFTNREV